MTRRNSKSEKKSGAMAGTSWSGSICARDNVAEDALEMVWNVGSFFNRSASLASFVSRNYLIRPLPNQCHHVVRDVALIPIICDPRCHI
jgi:hypothetical protein